MKILVVSDKVDDYIYSPGLKERMPDVELVFSCGDLPFYYLEFIVSSLNVPLMYVFGNHHTFEYARDELPGSGPDTASFFGVGGGQGIHREDQERHIRRAPEGCVGVDERVVYHNGLLIGGLAGSMRYTLYAPYQYTERQMRFKIMRMALRLAYARLRWGRPLDILIAHAPPYRIHDGRDLAHQGFRAFLAFMDHYNPQYLIHGHRHIYHLQRPEVTRYGQTTVINVYGHTLLDVEPQP